MGYKKYPIKLLLKKIWLRWRLLPFYNAGGNGGTIVKDLNTLLFINVIAPSNFIKTPGAGGGGGFNPNGATWGAAGSSGMVIIHY